MPDSVVLRDGTRLSLTVIGEGPPLVLCHGGPGLWDNLGPLAALIDSTVTVIRYDQRGCGRSSGADGPFTVDQFVADLDGVRQALGLETWWVGGHSWGALLALNYGLAHAKATRGVLYLAGTGIGDGYRLPYSHERERRLGRNYARWFELSRRERTSEEEHEWCVLQWSVDYSPAVDGRAHAEADWASRETGVDVNHRCNRELGADNRARAERLLSLLPTLVPPLRVLHGADDPRPAAATDTLLTCRRATRTVISEAGHSPWIEQPDDVQQHILGFMGVA